MERSERIILVGGELQTNMPNLLSSLAGQGFHVVQAPTTEELEALLDDNSGAIIVAYGPRGDDTARRVLKTVAGAQRKIPVVVVVNEGNFDEYYELMCEGAYDYFELRDGADVIERSVRWAVESRAA